MKHHPGSLAVDRPILDSEAVHFGVASASPAAEIAPREAPAPEAARAAVEAVQTNAPAPARGRLGRVLVGGAGLAVLALGAYYGWNYWTVGRFQVSTDDAYVQADTITIAPKVSGYLSALLVGDNEPVKAGQVLARIDERDYKVALEQADADVAAARAAIASKEAAIETQGSGIRAARATILVDQANETFAGQENKRYVDLASTGYGSVQNAQQAISRIAAARAGAQRGRATPRSV